MVLHPDGKHGQPTRRLSETAQKRERESGKSLLAAATAAAAPMAASCVSTCFISYTLHTSPITNTQEALHNNGNNKQKNFHIAITMVCI